MNLKKLFQFIILIWQFQANCMNSNLIDSSSMDTALYTYAEIEPQFGKNENSYYTFLSKESNYKTSKNRNSNSKCVYVEIIIEKNGQVKFNKIAKGVNEKLDKEAERIFNMMPNWKPGINSNKNVRFILIMPIWFD